MDCPWSWYRQFFLKNTCLRPLVKITINVSNFLIMYRTIIFFKEEKNLSGLLIKKLSVSKARCPESVFKTVQIILWETPVTRSSRKVFKKCKPCSRFEPIGHPSSITTFHKKISGRFVCKFCCFFILSGFLITVNSKYFFNSSCCILDYFILNCKLWDNFLISMIILILISSYILIFYRNFELIFEFMAPKRAPICGRNVCLSFFFCVFFISNSDNFNRRR